MPLHVVTIASTQRFCHKSFGGQFKAATKYIVERCELCRHFSVRCVDSSPFCIEVQVDDPAGQLEEEGNRHLILFDRSSYFVQSWQSTILHHTTRVHELLIANDYELASCATIRFSYVGNSRSLRGHMHKSPFSSEKKLPVWMDLGDGGRLQKID